MKLFTVEDRDASFIEVYRASALSHGYKLSLIKPPTIHSLAFNKFVDNYQHFSVNSRMFELACFRRYFEVLNLTSPGDNFIIADSDLIINDAAKNIPSELTDFFGFGLVGSIGQKNKLIEDDISPHFSFWSHALLKSFVEYLIFMYEQKKETLEQIYRNRQILNGNRASVSDMTLLKLFVDQNNIDFLNSNFVFKNSYVDHNFSMCESSNCKFKGNFGFKYFRFNNDYVEFLSEDYQTVRPIILHLQGKAKLVSDDIQKGSYLRATGKLFAITTAKKVRSFLC